MDVFSLFNKIEASPSTYSLSNVTMSSQGMAVDPDTYLFWDTLHPTTHGHNILAITAAGILASANRNGLASTRVSLTDQRTDGMPLPDVDPVRAPQ